MDFFRPGSYRNYASELFTVKYAPKTLQEYRGNEGVRQTFLSYLETENLPNLLIVGPHGCGKSLIAKLLVKEYLGEEHMAEGCLEIYGSLSRGKDVVSEKQSLKNKQKNFNCPGITNFMKKTTNLPANKLKVVLIYEFHQMSPEAQMALRRIIEQNTHRIRFIFLTEDHSEVIQALQSRSTLIQMQKFDAEDIDSILKSIMAKENITVNDNLLDLIKLNADGDIRIAINLLQILGPMSDESSWYEIMGIPEVSCLKKILAHCIEGNSLEAYKNLKLLLNQGFEICDLLDIFSRVLIRYPKFNTKKDFIRIFCHDMLTIEECYTETQLYNLFNHLVHVKAG